MAKGNRIFGVHFVLIDTGNAFQKGTERRLVREKMDDIHLVRGGDLGIRDNEGGEECVCPAAFTEAETANAQADEPVRGLQATPVIAVDRQAGGMPACTCELMELEGGKPVPKVAQLSEEYRTLLLEKKACYEENIRRHGRRWWN